MNANEIQFGKTYRVLMNPDGELRSQDVLPALVLNTVRAFRDICEEENEILVFNATITFKDNNLKTGIKIDDPEDGEWERTASIPV